LKETKTFTDSNKNITQKISCKKNPEADISLRLMMMMMMTKF